MLDGNDTRRLRVAYLGPEGSYTHQAALNTFVESLYDLIPSPTIASIFAAVQNGGVDQGVVPIENSTNGPVYQTFDLFVDRTHQHPDVRVCGDAYVPIHHCLLGLQAKVRPNSSATMIKSEFDRIRTLYSHPQAWTQCTPFLQAHLAHAERHDTSSTSRAAQLAAEDKSGSSASIASELAASLYELDVLAAGIEELPDTNTTRFLVLVKDGTRDVKGETLNTPSTLETSKSSKSLFSFRIPHEDPGVLARGLAVFGSHGVNLTSINARPSGEHPWHYEFFIELWGAWSLDSAPTNPIMRALQDLDGVVSAWKWLGSWQTTQQVVLES